ncbi:hypothetical protein D3C81_2181450 [compost metagenome]
MVLQIGGKGTGQLIELAVGEGLAQIAECRLVGKALAGLLQHRLDIGVLIGIDLGRNARWILVLPEVIGHGSPLLSNS